MDGLAHVEAGMQNLPVCDFWLQLWRLSPAAAGRRPLVLLASRVPEEVVSRRCAVACPRPPFSLPQSFPPETAPEREDKDMWAVDFTLIEVMT